tara:strand:+ start:6338 stop:7465 length:1128 start_codon:yes stop_codon:yes gene_type:complete
MYNICIIGFGISTLCFTLYLIDNNLIDNLGKIIILEKNNSICKNSLKYKNVNSNSTLGSMLSIFKQNKIFTDTLIEMEKKYNFNTYINLYEYNVILKQLCDIYVHYLIQNTNITIKFGVNIDNIQKYDIMYKVNNEIISEKIVIAMGGDQNLDFYKFKDINNIFNHIDENNIILSKKLFNTYDLQFLENKNLLIIGSSHSVFSILDLIISYKVKYNSINIYSKNKIKVFYKSKEECLKNNDNCSNEDICQETLFVNRFDGLRENSKKIYLNLNKYTNIKIMNNYNGNYKEYDYIIPCWGYFKQLPLINGNKLNYNIDCNINFNLVYNSNIYENIFLLGLSTNPKINMSQKSFSKSIDGIWFYYNVISKKLYGNLL